ncbi:MAG: SGNH/GDSL hydrolase family protein [Planctomycetaceae bacterium]
MAPTNGAVRGRLRRRLLLLLSSVAVTLLLAEGALRVRQRLVYGGSGPSVFKFLIDPATGLQIPQPNMTTGRIRTDSSGFRSAEPETPKPRGRIRIGFLGASTTFCAESSSNESTWPHLVWAGLKERAPALDLDYVNSGSPAYKLRELCTVLEARLKPLSPDILVIYEATNDLSFDTRQLAVAQGLQEGKPEDPSWLARRSVLWNLIEKNTDVWLRQRSAARGQNRLVFDAAELSRAFEGRLFELVEEAKNVAPLVVLATFSVQVRRSQSDAERLRACNTSLYYMPYMSVDGLLDGFEAYNEAIRRVGRRTGVLLVDGEETIPGDGAHFADSVHFTEEGCRKMARRVLDALSASPAYADLLAARSAR